MYVGHHLQLSTTKTLNDGRLHQERSFVIEVQLQFASELTSVNRSSQPSRQPDVEEE